MQVVIRYTQCFFRCGNCSYEEEVLKKYALHLLLLSHCWSVPQLKRVCICYLEHDFLTTENVIDTLLLARKCDAPRLVLICVRMVLKNFKSVSSTEGWKLMKRIYPDIEQELVESVVEADSVCRTRALIVFRFMVILL